MIMKKLFDKNAIHENKKKHQKLLLFFLIKVQVSCKKFFI